MKRHWNARLLTTATMVVLTCLWAHSVAAQAIDESSIRFSGDGGKIPAAGGRESGGPVPRLSDGTPNLGRIEVGKGAWLPKEFTSYLNILSDPPKAQGIPYQPWAKALREYRFNVTADAEEPGSFCLPLPAPQPYMRGGVHPIDFIQLPEQKRIIQLMEFPGHVWREIFMDGRPHPPKADLEESSTFMGHAIGRWEGETLVVDTVGFNEGTWVNKDGDPHTSQMHVIEKFTRTSLNNLHLEATIDDPGAYTRPWTIVQDLAWGPDWAIKEYMCQANNRYQEGYVRRTGGATGTGNAGAEWGHGHPAKGIFLGEWSPNAGTKNRLLVQLDWVGGAIVGTINPGPRGVPITKAELNPDTWTLRIEGGAGAAKVVLDGKFENLTWLGRSWVGTYTQGNQSGAFKITRQY